MESNELPEHILQQEEEAEYVEEPGSFEAWVNAGSSTVIDQNENGEFNEEIYIEGEQYIEEQHFSEQFDEDFGEETAEDFMFHEGSLEGSFAPPTKKKLTIVECEYCGLVLKHPSKIKEHMRTHTGEKPFECTMCGARFSQKTPFTNHMRRHMGDLPVQCSFCDKRFVNNAQKNAHELRHQGIKRRGPPRPHLKPPKRIVLQVELPEQLERPQQTDEEKAVRIETAPKFTPVPKPLSVEASKKLDEVIESVATGSNVKKKTKKIASRTPLIAQCNICGLMLRHPSKIKEHMRIHTGEKPFGCSVCGERFARMCSLKLHNKRKHSKEPKVPCSYSCGMSFVSIAVRNEHERAVHAGIKRYICSVTGCYRMFTRRLYLMKHRMKDHAQYHQPLFDPQAVATAEELDQQLDRAVNVVVPGEEFLEDSNSLDEVYHLPDGSIILPNGGRIMKGEFVEDQYNDEDYNSPEVLTEPIEMKPPKMGDVVEVLLKNSDVDEKKISVFPRILKRR